MIVLADVQLQPRIALIKRYTSCSSLMKTTGVLAGYVKAELLPRLS